MVAGVNANIKQIVTTTFMRRPFAETVAVPAPTKANQKPAAPAAPPILVDAGTAARVYRANPHSRKRAGSPARPFAEWESLPARSTDNTCNRKRSSGSARD